MTEPGKFEVGVVFRRAGEDQAQAVADVLDALDHRFPSGDGFVWRVLYPPVVHGAAPLGSGTGRTTCCNQLPIDLPLLHVVSHDPLAITCREARKPSVPAGPPLLTYGMREALVVLGRGQARRSNLTYDGGGSERRVHARSVDMLVAAGLARRVANYSPDFEITVAGREALDGDPKVLARPNRAGERPVRASILQGDETRQAVQEYVRRFWAEHDYAPTYRQIASAVGIALSTMQHHAQQLIAAGKLRLLPHDRGLALPAAENLSDG